MANPPALSTAKGGETYVGGEIRHSLTLLDVLYSNQFAGESLDAVVIEQTEENFYRGAPPKWLNFHVSEQAASDGTGTPFIKRDGYDTLVEQIHKSGKLPGISTVKLFHQPGCGGTTLAMKVLWDLKKTFRSAVLTDSTSDIPKVAEEVVCLFTAGSEGNQNTVLLLVDGEKILEDLQESIMMTIAEQKIDTRMPVVILLSLVRKDAALQTGHVFLQEVLSDTEEKTFNEKKKELNRKYRDKCKQFHGFNIMQTNFSQAYIKEACSVFKSIKNKKKPQGTQLAAFLSLLNAYVPGSYLWESQCLDFFKKGCLPLEDRMEPFSHLIITFQQDGSERKVCMAHPLIAKCCTEVMAEAGVTRSDTARNFLTSFCKDEVPLYLVGFVNKMLTKRRPKQKETEKEKNPINRSEMKEEREMFSRLILDIQRKEGEEQSASVLEVATNTFDKNPCFPQALARFYYIELKDYAQAETWAKKAKRRDPQNSFVADTLGQVHKNHLNKIRPVKPREILKLASKAIKAFEDEERLAENELGTDMKKDGKIKVSAVFNTRGMVGYLEVCNLVYDLLVKQNETWRGVLTKKVSLSSVLKSLLGFKDLINSLRDEVERKCVFFNKYLTYSKISMKKDDPAYISKVTSECYRKYVGEAPQGAVLHQTLKLKQADTTTGVLSCLDRECTESDLKEITACWEETFLHKGSDTALVNYIFSHIMLRNKGAISPLDSKHLTAFKQNTPPVSTESPEPYMLALLLHWPTESEDNCVLNLSKLIERMKNVYEQAHKKHLRSRYLRPLFFIGKGQDLNRIVHRKVLEGLILQGNEEAIQDWSREMIFKDPRVQEHLLKVHGETRNYRVYATIGGTSIEVDANVRNSLWRKCQVSFYLGFTIKGPVAFAIHTKTAEKGISRMDTSEFGACSGEMDSKDLTKLQPAVNRVDEVQTYSLQSQAGNYECSVSALRWVCKEEVSFKYKFSSWDEHMKRPLCTDYMPAGPLMDITVTAGKMEEVHLPHWICVDQNSTVLDKFAVLHADTFDVLEKVPEVKSSHIKFLQPTFPRMGVLIRKELGLPFYYDVLIYKTNKKFLTLDVYLVPRDSALQQEVEQNQKSCGSILILKLGPDKSVQMGDNFSLTTDKTDANIQPSTQELRCDGRNYFEVFIRDADSDFPLRLESEQNTVWTCTIHKGDYQSQTTEHNQGACCAGVVSKKKVEEVTPKTKTSGKSKRDPQKSSEVSSRRSTLPQRKNLRSKCPDSSDWIKLKPAVGEDKTYSHQSDAGRFECSESALRWVCKEKVIFKYQFCSWDKHMKRPSCVDYMPAGPLLDITLTSGKIEEVHLPHWICVDLNSKMSDMFKVLHVDTCGDFVEQVSEVTSYHVKLFQPDFSPLGAMIRRTFGLPVKVFYDTLIYRTHKEFLTLDVYLVPPDPAVKQEVEQEQNPHRSIKLLKPGPDKSLQLGDKFSLTTNKMDADIQPSTRELRCDGRNYFEVFIRDAESDFTLRLQSKQNTVWTCTIHKGDYQSQTTDHNQGEHFVDRHRTALINRVKETDAILDKLLEKELISHETYEAVRALKPQQEQMREIYKFVTAAGTSGKDTLYEILKRMKSMELLLSDLERSG